VLGIISGSVAVLSDAELRHGPCGGAAALVSVRIAKVACGREPSYGHGKVEAVSAPWPQLSSVGGGVITYQAIRRLIEGSRRSMLASACGHDVAAAANIVTTSLMRREANRSGSMALRPKRPSADQRNPGGRDHHGLCSFGSLMSRS
jgi:divalent metal cation (Fe/Co/Zn/Cd) transporter